MFSYLEKNIIFDDNGFSYKKIYYSQTCIIYIIIKKLEIQKQFCKIKKGGTFNKKIIEISISYYEKQKSNYNIEFNVTNFNDNGSIGK